MALRGQLSPSRIAVMRKWLADCQGSHHPRCDDKDEFYLSSSGLVRNSPKRFIKVGNPGQTNLVHIVEMDHAPQEPFAALSYCWGPTEVNYSTTASRLENHKQQLAWDRLPKTVQDAITVTQNLGIPYLWVDALCIVQRSEYQGDAGLVVDDGDWAEEAVKMAGVYRHACVTIIALSPKSSDQGFLDLTTESGLPSSLEQYDLFELVQKHHMLPEAGHSRSCCCPLVFSISTKVG